MAISKLRSVEMLESFLQILCVLRDTIIRSTVNSSRTLSIAVINRTTKHALYARDKYRQETLLSYLPTKLYLSHRQHRIQKAPEHSRKLQKVPSPHSHLKGL